MSHARNGATHDRVADPRTRREASVLKRGEAGGTRVNSAAAGDRQAGGRVDAGLPPLGLFTGRGVPSLAQAPEAGVRPNFSTSLSKSIMT